MTALQRRATRYATSLRGFEPGTTLHGFHSTDGTFIALPKYGVLAGVGLADALT